MLIFIYTLLAKLAHKLNVIAGQIPHTLAQCQVVECPQAFDRSHDTPEHTEAIRSLDELHDRWHAECLKAKPGTDPGIDYAAEREALDRNDVVFTDAGGKCQALGCGRYTALDENGLCSECRPLPPDAQPPRRHCDECGVLVYSLDSSICQGCAHRLWEEDPVY